MLPKNFINMKRKIVVGIPPKAHLTLAMDEVNGFREIGYDCNYITYGRNDQSINVLNKLIGVIRNAINIVFALYRFSPAYLYLNSRFEPVASTRDAISLLIIRALYFKKVKIIIKTHGSDFAIFSPNNSLFNKQVVSFLAKNVNAWFFLSSEEKDIVHKNNPSLAKNAYVTANIVDAKRSVNSQAFQTEFKLPDNKFKFLFVGRIVREKGVFAILESIPHLPFKDKCQFIFVGDGPDLKELIALSEQLKVTDNVSFVGFINDDKCDHFYANTDALVFPTFFNEGFPMALFKAVAAGLPIITTKIRAAKDHLIEPDNTLWVSGDSTLPLVDAITRIYENPGLRASMSLNNRKLGEEFSRHRVVTQMHHTLATLK